MDLDLCSLADLYAYPATDTPWVRTNFVSTLDGAAYAEDGRSGSLGGPADTRVFALLRSLADVIVIGAGTARAEGYQPVKASEVDGDLRARLGLAPIPPIAVVSHSLDIPVVLAVPGQFVITTLDAPAARLDALRERVDVITAGTGAVDWSHVLGEFADRGLNRVLCEGGPTLHGTLTELDLIDDLCLSIAPIMATGTAPRIAHSRNPVTHDMSLAHCHQVDDLLLTRWVRKRP